MLEKLNQSIESQKVKLSELVTGRENAKESLKLFTKQIAQLEGAITALEYAKALLQAEEKHQKDSDE